MTVNPSVTKWRCVEADRNAAVGDWSKHERRIGRFVLRVKQRGKWACSIAVLFNDFSDYSIPVTMIERRGPRDLAAAKSKCEGLARRLGIAVPRG